MLANSKAFSGFAVDDLEQARRFYGEVLGLKTTEENDLLTLHLAGDRDTLIYPKPDFEPATYTVLNFPVDDIDRAVDDLSARGVTLRALRRLRPGREGRRPRRRARHRLVQGPGRQHLVRPPALV